MGTHPELRAALLARAESDQDLRRKLVGIEDSTGVVTARLSEHAQILRDLRHVDADKHGLDEGHRPRSSMADPIDG